MDDILQFDQTINEIARRKSIQDKNIVRRINRNKQKATMKNTGPELVQQNSCSNF